ncbi:energy-coupling factor ABC transporter ATP-binding protein [Bacillus sp. IITD106]|nr:energy-coupling factor ABC transporter ATP-binding protein [Bacillus sp. IITD106]
MFRLDNVKYKQILHIDYAAIPEGKTTCIIGKSGSGKTTFIKLLNGLISPDAGEVYYKGKALSQIDLIQHRRRIIMLQQTPSIYDGTIQDNLQIGRKFSNLDDATKPEMEKVLDCVNLHKELKTIANELSGGEKQRLALARILLLDPEVVIMDEPTAALDEETAQEMMKKILQIGKDKGQTMIMVTHSKEVVEAFAETVIEIDAGRVR